MIGSQVERLTG